MSRKSLLVTGNPLSAGHVAELESLGFSVINGSSAALLKLGVRKSDLQRDVTEDEVRELLSDCDVYVYGGLEPASSQALSSADRLGLITFLGTGWADIGCVDPDAAQQRRILVTNTPHANAPSVAEIAMGLIIALDRAIIPMNSDTKAGHRNPIRRRDVANLRLGIIGLGHIGSLLAKHATAGFGMEVVYAGPHPKPELEAQLGVTRIHLDQLLQSCDVVSIHTPLAATRGLLGAGELGMLQPHAILINLASPEIIDGAALVAALERGDFASAALDEVYSDEPEINERLRHLGDDRLIMLPHAAWLTEDSYKRMSDMALQSIRDLVNDVRPLAHQVLPTTTS